MLISVVTPNNHSALILVNGLCKILIFSRNMPFARAASLADAGILFLADPAGVVTVGVAPQTDAGDVAVRVALPVVAGAVFLADLAGVVTISVASLASPGMALPADIAGVFTVGVTDLAVARAMYLADAGMALPADLAGVVTMGVAPLTDAEAASPAYAGSMFPAVSAERVPMGVTDLTDVIPVNVVGVPTYNVSWGDRLSPGVWCRDKTLLQRNFYFRPDGSMRCDWDEA